MWSEAQAGETATSNITYSCDGLLVYWDLSRVTVEIKYFSGNAAARIFPYQNFFGASYCYTDVASSDIECLTQTYQLNVQALIKKQITFETIVFPGGFFLFDSITIIHKTSPEPLLPARPAPIQLGSYQFGFISSGYPPSSSWLCCEQ